MKAVSRPRNGRSFASPGGFGYDDYRLSLDNSMHPTEAITEMYGDYDDASSDGGSVNHSRNNSASSINSQVYTAPTTPSRTLSGRSRNAGVSRLDEDMNSTGPSSPTMRSPNSPITTDTATHSFPLNDIDYESNPQAVQQELNNLQALRRMSMDVSSVANDPDLPAFNLPSSQTQSTIDSGEDASKLFWVPARLHPELAPQEFKTFVESRVQQIRGHKEDSTSSNLRVETGPSLRRKKSMLSRQIDNSEGRAAEHYKDGAEKLRRQRANSGELQLTVSDLDDVLSKDPSDLVKQLTLNTTERALTGEPGEIDGDLPIFPVAPLGQSLRRSTRTAVRRGSLRKGERVAPSRRGTRATNHEDDAHYLPSDEKETSATELHRRRGETIPAIAITTDGETAMIGQATSPREIPMYSISDIRAKVQAAEADNRHDSAPTVPRSSSEKLTRTMSEPTVPVNRKEVPSFSHPLPYHQELSAQQQEQQQNQPRATEEDNTSRAPSRDGIMGFMNGSPLQQQGNDPLNQPGVKRPNLKRTGPLSSDHTLQMKDVVTAATGLSGPDMRQQIRRSDSAPGLPTGTAKEGGRKSSWAWLMLGADAEKEKDKDGKSRRIRRVKSSEKTDEKDRDIQKEREKESDRPNEKNSARLDLITKSIEANGKPDRRGSLDSQEKTLLDAERTRDKEKLNKKATVQEAPKKESGLFSSIFGGSKKKSGETSGKSKSNSNLAVPSTQETKPTIPPTYYYTRFPIHIERAIYRLSHLKLANPRRPLLQQVLLSNFMYAYLAKVQMMQPQVQTGQQAAQAKMQAQQRQQQQQRQQSPNSQHEQENSSQKSSPTQQNLKLQPSSQTDHNNSGMQSHHDSNHGDEDNDHDNTNANDVNGNGRDQRRNNDASDSLSSQEAYNNRNDHDKDRSGDQFAAYESSATHHREQQQQILQQASHQYVQRENPRGRRDGPEYGPQTSQRRKPQKDNEYGEMWS